MGIVAHIIDSGGINVSGAQVFMDINDTSNVVISLQGFSDTDGIAVLKWKTSRKQAAGAYTGTVTNIIKNGYQLNPDSSVTVTSFSIQ